MLNRGDYGELYLTDRIVLFLKEWYYTMRRHSDVIPEFEDIAVNLAPDIVFKNGMVYKVVQDVGDRGWNIDGNLYRDLRDCISSFTEENIFVDSYFHHFIQNFEENHRIRVANIEYRLDGGVFIIKGFPIDLLMPISFTSEEWNANRCAEQINNDCYRNNNGSNWHLRSPFNIHEYRINIEREWLNDDLRLIEELCTEDYIHANQIVNYGRGEEPHLMRGNPGLPGIAGHQGIVGNVITGYNSGVDNYQAIYNTPSNYLNPQYLQDYSFKLQYSEPCKEEEVENNKYSPVNVFTPNYKGYGLIVNKQNSDSTFSCLIRERGKVRFIKIRSGEYKQDKGALKEFCSIKVKKSDVSTQVFKNKRLKEEMVGNIYPITDYNQGYKCSTDGLARDIVVIKNNNKETKFVKEDVEVHYPKELVAYNAPKDRTPQAGKKAVISNNSGLNLKKGEEVTIEAVYPNQTIEKRGNNLVRIVTKAGNRMNIKSNKIRVL